MVLNTCTANWEQKGKGGLHTGLRTGQCPSVPTSNWLRAGRVTRQQQFVCGHPAANPGQGKPGWEGHPARSRSMRSSPGQLTCSSTPARTAQEHRAADTALTGEGSEQQWGWKAQALLKQEWEAVPGGSSAKVRHTQPASPGSSQGCAEAADPLLLLLPDRPLSRGNNTSGLGQVKSSGCSSLNRLRKPVWYPQLLLGRDFKTDIF